MKGDMPQAAINLSSRLPVREHRQPEPDKRKIAKPMYDFPSQRGGIERKSLRIKGVEYSSTKEARRKLHVGAKTIMAWLADGTASYL